MHQVGAGVLGPVFRGYDPEHDRAVAIKAFPLDLTPEQARDLAADLGRLPTLGLAHASIIAPLGAGADGSTAYLVEEYFVAESADVALKQYGPAPVPDAMRLIGQLAGALDFAAAAGVHHGALHPRDILVAPHEVRLTGLGVAAALERVGFSPPVRRPYAAPERVTGGLVAGAGDVFSLACVAFELLTGRRPTLAGDTVTVDTGGIQAADAVALAEVFARALSPRAEDRHPAVLAFAAALKHALTGDPLQAGADTERPRPRRAGTGGRKTPPLPLEPERDTPAMDTPPDVRPESLSPVDPPVDLPFSPAPGSTPLPSFLQSYPKALPEEPASAPEPEAAHKPPVIDEPPVMEEPPVIEEPPEPPIPEPPISEPPIPEPPISEPPIPEPPISEPRPLRLEDLDLGGYDGEPALAPVSVAPESLGDQMSMFASLAPPPEPTESKRRMGLVPLLGMLLVGILLGFPAGYLFAPRGQLSTPTAPAIGTRGTEAHPAPAQTPAGAPEAASSPTRSPAPPAGQVIEASGQPAASGSTAARAAATPGDTPERMAARERRLARARARRNATRAAGGTVGAGAATSGRKATPARRGTAFEGRLMIASKPAGARVRLDGHPVGITPLTLPTVTAGSHAITLELAGHHVWSSAVQVTAGQQKQVTASLERRPGG